MANRKMSTRLDVCWRWVLLLLLPLLMAIVLLAIYGIWSAHNANRLADIVASVGLAATLFGMSVWWFSTWAQAGVVRQSPQEPACRAAANQILPLGSGKGWRVTESSIDIEA